MSYLMLLYAIKNNKLQVYIYGNFRRILTISCYETFQIKSLKRITCCLTNPSTGARCITSIDVKFWSK